MKTGLAAQKSHFKKTLHKFYKTGRRDFPWRETTDPYHILVSEVMLQQTQTGRVIPKYESFLKRFPTAASLAKAPLGDVLKLWQGLGYNRRAVYLKKTAEAVVRDYKGKFPKTTTELIALPGIGQSTAGAVQAFAFNLPSIFIETNIRSVFIYFFFSRNVSQSDTIRARLQPKVTKTVSDKDIIKLIEETIDKKNPREWYYALYDYGAMLKSQGKHISHTLNKASKHYQKQSKFEGSNRQLRSRILKLVLKSAPRGLREADIAHDLNLKNEASVSQNITKNLKKMAMEGLINRTDKVDGAWYNSH